MFPDKRFCVRQVQQQIYHLKKNLSKKQGTSCKQGSGFDGLFPGQGVDLEKMLQDLDEIYLRNQK